MKKLVIEWRFNNELFWEVKGCINSTKFNLAELKLLCNGLQENIKISDTDVLSIKICFPSASDEILLYHDRLVRFLDQQKILERTDWRNNKIFKKYLTSD